MGYKLNTLGIVYYGIDSLRSVEYIAIEECMNRRSSRIIFKFCFQNKLVAVCPSEAVFLSG